MLDSFQVKLMAIETEYDSGTITEENAQARKKEVQEESDFLGVLDGASKYVSGSVKIILCIFIVSFTSVILIGTLFKGESVNYVINSYFPFILSNGILCMLPAFLWSLGMRIIAVNFYRY
jgi:flagellar biosynthesis protein FlhA